MKHSKTSSTVILFFQSTISEVNKCRCIEGEYIEKKESLLRDEISNCESTMIFGVAQIPQTCFQKL